MTTTNFNDSVCTSGFWGYFDRVSTPTRRKWWFSDDSQWTGFVHGTDLSMPCGGGGPQPFWARVDSAASFVPTITGGLINIFTGATDEPHLVQIGVQGAYSNGNAYTFLDGTNALFTVTGATPGVSAYSTSMTMLITGNSSPVKYYGATHALAASTNIQPQTRRPHSATNTFDGLPNWQLNRNYTFGDTIAGSGAYNGIYYQCWNPHTSSISGFAYDLGLGNWLTQYATWDLGSSITFDAKTSEIWVFADAAYVGYSIDGGQMTTILLSGESGKKTWRKILNSLDNTQFHRYYIVVKNSSALAGECSGVMLSPDGIYRNIEAPRTIGQYGDSITLGAGAAEGGFASCDYHRIAGMMGCLGSQNGVSGFTNYDVFRQLHYTHFKQAPEIAILATSYNNTAYITLKRMRSNNVASLKLASIGSLNPISSTRPISGYTITVTDCVNTSYNGSGVVSNMAYNGVSTTSNTIGTGAKTFIVSTNLDISAGEIIKLDYTGGVSNYMFGSVTSYNSGTGELVLNITLSSGSGTYASWYVDGGTISYASTGADEAWTTDTTTYLMPFYKDCADKLLEKGIKRLLIRPSIPGSASEATNPGFANSVKARLALEVVKSLNDPRVVYVDTTGWIEIPTSEGSAPWGNGGGSVGTHPTSAGYAVMANYELKQYQRLFRPWMTRMPSFVKSTRGYIRPPNSSCGD